MEKNVRPSFRESFRKLSDEFSKRQHIGIIVGRFIFMFLITLAIVLAWRDRFGFTPGINSVPQVHGVFVIVVVILIIQLQYIITHLIQIYLPAEDPVKSKKLVVYFLEVVIGLITTIPCAIGAFGTVTIDNFHDGNMYLDQVIIYQNIEQLRPDYMKYIGYLTLCFLPILFLYLVELSLMAGVMRPELQIHHILTICYTLIFYVSEVSTTVLKISFVQAFFAVIEWPLFMCLIHYRLTMSGDVSTKTVRWNMYLFSALRYYWAITRLIMVGCITYIFIDGFNYMSTFLQCLYPIGLAIQIATLGITQKELMGIHGSLVKKLDTSIKKTAIDQRRRTMVSERNINITDA
jgi:hypothetical protein